MAGRASRPAPAAQLGRVAGQHPGLRFPSPLQREGPGQDDSLRAWALLVHGRAAFPGVSAGLCPVGRPAHAGPRSVRVAAIDDAFRNSRGAGRCFRVSGLPGSRRRRTVEPWHCGSVQRLALMPMRSPRCIWLPAGPPTRACFPPRSSPACVPKTGGGGGHVSLNDPQRRTLIAQDPEGALAVIGFAEVGPSRDDDAEAGTGELMALHVTRSRWRQEWAAHCTTPLSQRSPPGASRL